LTVKLLRIHHRRYRDYKLILRGVPVRCGRRARIVRPTITGGETIWNRYAHDRHFGGTVAVEGDPQNPSFADTSRGRLLRPNLPLGHEHAAKGVVRVWGSHVPLRAHGSADCHSGRRRWTARTVGTG
jgi:hypothetical protein